ncbi:MAG: transposase [Chthoniobacterales bacterium]
MPRSTFNPEKYSARPARAIPAPSSLTSSAKSFASQPSDRAIHVIADNLGAHKTKQVFSFLEAHPNLRLHYTPTYSSWLNQVEIWFSKIQRHVITGGVFTSVNDLARKLMRYIRTYNQTSTPIRRIYKTSQKESSQLLYEH